MATDPFRHYEVQHFFHFTDRRNLPSIQHFGGLYSLRRLQEEGVYIPVPSGNELSHRLDIEQELDRYVHLCLTDKHPMEWVARDKGRIQSSIFLQVSLEVLDFSGVMFAPDVSNKSGVELHTMDTARDLIDFEVAYTRMDWRDPEIKQRLDQCRKCEILVPDLISLDLIRNFPDD